MPTWSHIILPARYRKFLVLASMSPRVKACGRLMVSEDLPGRRRRLRRCCRAGRPGAATLIVLGLPAAVISRAVARHPGRLLTVAAFGDGLGAARGDDRPAPPARIVGGSGSSVAPVAATERPRHAIAVDLEGGHGADVGDLDAPHVARDARSAAPASSSPASARRSRRRAGTARRPSRRGSASRRSRRRRGADRACAASRGRARLRWSAGGSARGGQEGEDLLVRIQDEEPGARGRDPAAARAARPTKITRVVEIRRPTRPPRRSSRAGCAPSRGAASARPDRRPPAPRAPTERRRVASSASTSAVASAKRSWRTNEQATFSRGARNAGIGGLGGAVLDPRLLPLAVAIEVLARAVELGRLRARARETDRPTPSPGCGVGRQARGRRRRGGAAPARPAARPAASAVIPATRAGDRSGRPRRPGPRTRAETSAGTS